MSRIVILNDHDLYLTYTWHGQGENHGICGHTFEVIDYYLILKKHFKVGILLQEEVDPKIFEKAIREKYNLDDEAIQDVLNNTRYHNRPTLLKGKNILITDGAIKSLDKISLLFDNVFLFGCYDRDILKVTQSNWYTLLDHRIYGNIGINYVKKINFKNLIIPTNINKKTLIYATEGSRDLTREYVKNLVSEYNDEFIYVANKTYNFKNIERLVPIAPPVVDINNAFDKYIYTKTLFQSDCSPRFIAECHYFGKEVVYHDIDYLDTDLGLKYRIYDIENNFDSLFLNEDDEIIGILKGIINEKTKL